MSCQINGEELDFRKKKHIQFRGLPAQKVLSGPIRAQNDAAKGGLERMRAVAAKVVNPPAEGQYFTRAPLSGINFQSLATRQQ